MRELAWRLPIQRQENMCTVSKLLALVQSSLGILVDQTEDEICSHDTQCHFWSIILSSLLSSILKTPVYNEP
jgi:hypothetical protein